MIACSKRACAVWAFFSCLLTSHLSQSAPAISAAADINGDGIIQLDDSGPAPSDISTPATPFVFWLNDDQDDLNLYESWPHDNPDASNEKIGSLRDLEDLARLHIRVNGASPGDNLWLKLSWAVNSAAAPAIRVWQAQDPNGSRAYLLDEKAGIEQLSHAHAHSALGVVRQQQALFMQLHAFDLQGSETLLPLLFEAIEAGSGRLRVELIARQQVLAQTYVDMELRPVKTFYDRVAVPWPDEITFPYKYKGQPPQAKLTWEPESFGYSFQKPWYEDDNIVVWVHGWIPNDDENYRRTLVFSFETMFKRLWHQGYRGRVIHFHWPTRKVQGAFGLLTSEYLALKSAEPLYRFAQTLPKNKRLHITCHSLGGVILAEALRLGLDFDNAIFQVSAVPAESFDSSATLLVPELVNTPTPRDNDRWGWADYIGSSNTRVYNFFNPHDITWVGWNLAQKEAKPYWKYNRTYKYFPDEANGEHFRLKYWWFFSRPVKDRHEAMAYALNSKTQALGAEARVHGLVHQNFDLAKEPFEFGNDHVAAWRWNPQLVMPYFNLMLDVFNIPYNGLSVE